MLVDLKNDGQAETGCTDLISCHGQESSEEYVELMGFHDTQLYMQKKTGITKILYQ
jgi:hypothetical protein